ncbi:MAG: RNA polymerase subunit sigma, partial [Verrucomicrobia bacterium]|nr:RNA polymerase subunit sigma [Verrucomicrobiota bacterium]
MANHQANGGGSQPTKQAGKRANKKSGELLGPAIMDPAAASESLSPLDAPEFRPVIRDLIRLAKEQDYLTFDDINEALPDTETDLELLEELIARLRTMKFRIIDSAEVDNLKGVPVGDSEDSADDEEDDESEKRRSADREGRLDILDDPVRMYLKQMGQVPLLNREQEVSISKRIEKSEAEVKKILCRFGFIPDAYLDLASRLEQGDERFDRLILDKKIESRARYLKNLDKLREQVISLRDKLSKTYAELRDPRSESPDEKLVEAWEKGHGELAKAYLKFYFKQRVTEDLVDHAQAYVVRSAALSAQAAAASERKEKAEAAKARTAFEQEVW